MDFVSQVVVLLYLFEEGTNLLMIIPSAFGCAIALWKCQRGAGFRLVKVSGNAQDKEEDKEPEKYVIWNKFFRLFGYELQATRLRATRNKQRRYKKKTSHNDSKTTTKTTGAII